MRRQIRGWLTALLTTAVVAAGAVTASAGTAAEATGTAEAAEADPGSGWGAPRPAGPTGPAKPPTLPATVDGGAWKAGHVQGMAVDRRKGFVYFSFTNLLVKTDLTGKPVGSVTGFTGHLGDLDFNTKDSRVYGSLEYKAAEAFYIAIFDGDRITEMDMDAQTTDVVTTVHLKEVVDDYTADMDGDGVFDGNTAKTADHRYGCSGIDGVAFGPGFDDKRRDDKRGTRHTQLLTVAYGVYANTTRQDNDNQVLLQYDIRRWKKYERPLTEADPHTSGPGSPDGKYFSYTGNTTYGVQNLDYDAHTGNWLLAAYKGTKTQFPNYSLFVLDGSKRPVSGPVSGQPTPERGRLLPLLAQGLYHPPSGTYGWESTGQYGLVSLDDGRYYLAEAGTVVEDGVTKQTGKAVLNRWTGGTPTPFTPVTAIATDGTTAPSHSSDLSDYAGHAPHPGHIGHVH
ncbi:hypothetical protein OG292_05700 [Streptomyces sp. NBC_01511]|uniref:hypothetical protein n=1 Tax=unclassified Streptomyces TaxID=2593676 RepID=UPI003866A25F